MSIPKVLVCAPTSSHKDYCFEEWAEQVKSFTYPNYDVLLVDNSKNKKYHYKLKEKGFNVIYHEPKGSPIRYITECQNIMRGVAIEGGYDYIFSLETDVFCEDNDIIQKMLSIDCSIYTITYFIEKQKNLYLCFHALNDKDEYLQTLVTPEEISHGVIDGKIQDISKYRIGNNLRLYGTGVGCTMISRAVFETIPFRIDERFPEVFSDSYFYLDTEKYSISTILDTTTIAHHKSLK